MQYQYMEGFKSIVISSILIGIFSFVIFFPSSYVASSLPFLGFIPFLIPFFYGASWYIAIKKANPNADIPGRLIALVLISLGLFPIFLFLLIIPLWSFGIKPGIVGILGFCSLIFTLAIRVNFKFGPGRLFSTFMFSTLLWFLLFVLFASNYYLDFLAVEREILATVGLFMLVPIWQIIMSLFVFNVTIKEKNVLEYSNHEKTI